jgi:folate-binding protein YgfZ
VRSRRLAGDGVELVAPREAAGALIERLSASVRDREGRVAGWKAVEVVRVECGIPRYGIDISESNLPQETGLEGAAISYDKGCYLGQEVVARIHFRGHVNRRLGGFTLVGDLPSGGAALREETGKEVGLVTSAVESPDFGQIALGYVRREVEAGARLSWSDGGRQGTATVIDLPFREAAV